jgi:hypothetical protein
MSKRYGTLAQIAYRDRPNFVTGLAAPKNKNI